MESAAAAAEVGEASLLDSKVQCCDGAVGRALFIPVLFLAVLRKALDAGATGGVVGAAPAPVTCLLFKS